MNFDDVRTLFFEQHPDPMWVYEPASLRFLAVNEAAVRRYGWSRDEFLAMTIADIRPSADLERLLESVRNSPPGRDEAGTWRHLRRSGEVVHVDIVSHSVQFDGRDAQLVCARDVTRVVELDARLGEATELLRFARAVAKLGAWRVTLPDGPVEWSEETAAIHELPGVRTMPLGRGIEFYAPEFRDRIRDVYTRCVRDGVPYDVVMQILTARGRRVWVRTIGEPVRDASGAIVAVRGAFQDVSELMAAREREADANRRLALTLEHFSDAFVTVDAAWCITYVNGNAARLLERTRSELLGRNVWDAFPDAAGTVFQDQYERALRTNAPVRFTGYAAPYAMWLEVAAYPFPEGLAVYFRDVTERRRAEEAVRLSDERFHLVARATNDVVWDLDLVAGTLWWSESLQQVFGHDPARLRRGIESWVDCIHPEDRERVLASHYAIVEGGGEKWSDEYRFLRADGTPATVVDRGFVMRGQDGRAVRMIGCVSDVTERRELDARLRQAQKLEAVGQLTGGVAHDFNNLLTVMLGSAELLALQLADRPALRKLADTIVLTAGRGADLTKRLLAFARRQALDPRVVDVGQLAAGMDGLLRRVLSEDVHVRVVRPAGLWLTEVDPGQLEVALLNLAINARDAMPGGGRITIECSNVASLPAMPGASDACPGEYVCVTVRDTGTGMAPHVVEHAFEPFFTTKDVGRGTGLGLSMVYGFVQQSGGHAAIESTPGEGTTVRLYFPRSARRADGADATATDDEPCGGREHVLVVEDEALVREHAVSVLRALGYRVSAAANGTEALALLATHGDVALLFTDLVMPGGMNGRQLAAAARRLRPELRVLYTSGYAEDVLGPGGERNVQLIGKPYRRDELAAQVRSALDALSA